VSSYYYFIWAFLHIFLSLTHFYNNTTRMWMNEGKKSLFGLNMRLCVYIMPFIQHNFFLYFLSTFLFSTYFTVQFSSSDRTHARARRDFATCEKSLLIFCFNFLKPFFRTSASLVNGNSFTATFGSCYFSTLFFLLHFTFYLKTFYDILLWATIMQKKDFVHWVIKWKLWK
jgi:hypothetical protein